MEPNMFFELRQFICDLNTRFPISGKRHSITLNDSLDIMVTVWVREIDGVVRQHFINFDSPSDYTKPTYELLDEFVKYLEETKVAS